MNVLLVSQCSKRALVETRRILDQFAERRGDRTWQTPITQDGLDTLRRLLRKTARKNTAVACHWIRGRDHSELLWIVGDGSQFSAEGAVPTNRTTRDVLRLDDENDWHSAEDIRLLAIMAALFHDFGKASAAFQAKLKKASAGADAYRHEWVSLRLFEAFVGQGNDEDWLQRLANEDEGDHLERLRRDDKGATASPFKQGHLPPLARAIGWLVVSHHRLPTPPSSEPFSTETFSYLPSPIIASWNSARADATTKEKSDCWRFPQRLPFASKDWRKRAAECARAMLARNDFLQRGKALLSDPYVMHLARLALMLADHHYSSQPANSHHGDAGFPLYANTDRETNAPKQRLDEHLIGVSTHARKLMGVLPRLERQLPRIARHKGFKRRATQERFRWQDKAYDLAASLQARAQRQGFFGINMASTGCGKTLANGRIMYGLSDPQRGARFSLALGLRTLTLQTGMAYRERLGLGEDDMAVLVGGGAVRELYAMNRQTSKATVYGSESTEDLLLDNSHVYFEGHLENGPLKQWLGSNPSASRLIDAPVLVCTIDHLMPATESVRGGHQIAPILRLLTADLVLDEPDDFDMGDLPALSRLVHWAGLFGSRVLLSSATLPPAFLQGLFAAYCAGRAVFQQNRGIPGQPLDVCCAWFDEFRCSSSDHHAATDFAAAHTAFIAQRLAALKTQPVRRRAEIKVIAASNQDRLTICRDLAIRLTQWMPDLHALHHSTVPNGDQRVSFGLVRMANIDPLIDTAQALYTLGAAEGICIHLCVYHARHPLLIRSAIERQLDHLLQRDDADAIFASDIVRRALASSPERDHLFVVLASPVAEVGRDHDYDWAVVEPSSMRSLIQLAGRIRRHRPGPCQHSNIYVLDRNVAALENASIAYRRPGFEDENFRLDHHHMDALLTAEQFECIDATPRIVERTPLEPTSNLADLEHHRLRTVMLGDTPLSGVLPVTYWWQTLAPLCGELQTRQRFRSGPRTERYALLPDEDHADRFHFWKDNDGDWSPLNNLLHSIELDAGPRIDFWGCPGLLTELQDLATRLEQDLRPCAQRFAGMELRENTQGWWYHPALGFKRRK